MKIYNIIHIDAYLSIQRKAIDLYAIEHAVNAVVATQAQTNAFDQAAVYGLNATAINARQELDAAIRTAAKSSKLPEDEAYTLIWEWAEGRELGLAA